MNFYSLTGVKQNKHFKSSVFNSIRLKKYDDTITMSFSSYAFHTFIASIFKLFPCLIVSDFHCSNIVASMEYGMEELYAHRYATMLKSKQTKQNAPNKT